MHRRRLLCTLACVQIGVWVALPSAQDPPLPTFRTEANYVRVDVFPTTRDGVPVADLRPEDFEVFEDKVSQKVEQFEHVVIRSGLAQDTGREPSTVAESREAAQNPRARVFVLFLDTNHVAGDASRRIQKPLLDALDRLIGPDDLLAVMTPSMSARDITFSRRTTSIDTILSRWWGGRDRLNLEDPIEQQYAVCYPGIGDGSRGPAPDQGIAQEMILRRREEETLNAVEDLVRFLRGVREERKAILTITDGWRLFQRNPALARPLSNAPPPGIRLGTDPITGRLGDRGSAEAGGIDRRICELDRQRLSQLDGQRQFREILDQANRANASFYPIDPRGLAVFDEPILPNVGVGAGMSANPTLEAGEDLARLTARSTSLRTLAESTDGVAVIQSDLARGLRRITDDLSSYYLLGYYSTGKLDGKFHSITVRVKRPGVQVRARRGYLSATAAEAAALAATATKTVAPVSADAVETRAIEAAVGSLSGVARELPLRLRMAAGWTPGGAATIWAVAEVGRAASGAGTDDWTGGGQADAMLIDQSGATVATGRAPIVPGGSSVKLALTSSALAPGDYQVRIRTKAAGASVAANEAMAVVLPAAPDANGAIFIRRGPTTGNRDVPTADVRFRRTDRLRVEIPTPGSDAVSARVLDRAGKALPIPVTGSVRDDADGSRWRSAELALAPLAPGDYIIELAGGAGRTLVAFRVVP